MTIHFDIPRHSDGARIVEILPNGSQGLSHIHEWYNSSWWPGDAKSGGGGAGAGGAGAGAGGAGGPSLIWVIFSMHGMSAVIQVIFGPIFLIILHSLL